MSTRTYSLHDFVLMIARRRWLIVLPVALGAASAPLLARLAPAKYRSEALMMVVPQRVPDNYVKPTVSQTIEERLPSITDQILSRSRLERIIVEMDLYKAERGRRVMEDVVQMMRTDIQTTPGGKELNSFRVSYVSQTAEMAQKVTERLASLYIEQNLKDRESQAENTSQFLDTQLEDAKRRLIEQEKKLEAYRKSHAGQLPTQLQGNLQAIQNANLQLQGINESMNRALERRLLIERQVADAQALPLSPVMTGLASDPPPAATTSQQLEIARARLSALLQRYTPDHPEVVAMQRTVDDLLARSDGETPLAGSPTPAEMNLSPAEAAQRKRILDLQAELQVIDLQLKVNRTEEGRLKKLIADYQAKVDVLPTRESELVELTRDYSTLQAAYANLLMKREESVIAANLERRQIGEQFKLLDVASLPEKPYNQVQRLAVMASGMAVALVLSLLALALLEYRDSSFRSKEEVLKAFALPVLASIPAMVSYQEARRARWRGRLVDAVGTAVVCGAAAVLVVWRFVG